MIFTLPSKQLLPIVALLSCLISDKGISALDMDMEVVNTSNNDQPESFNEARKLRHRVLPEKIIGGEEVDANEYPWFARGTRGNNWWGCGGSLVTPEFVLSAGELLQSRYYSSYLYY